MPVGLGNVGPEHNKTDRTCIVRCHIGWRGRRSWQKKYSNNSLNYEVKYQFRGTPSDHVQVYVRFMNRGISSVLLSR